MISGELIIRQARVGDVAVVHATGEVDQLTSARLEQGLLDACTRSPRPTTVVADLSAVSFLNSSGLSTLVRVQGHCEQRALELVVVASIAARRSMQITALDQVFTLVDSVRDAVDFAGGDWDPDSVVDGGRGAREDPEPFAGSTAGD
jgi:anti-sigma B factor antagonist